jgi:1,4-alpha-glucan branching enzyme
VWNRKEERAGVIVYKRKGKKPKDDLIVLLNMNPVVKRDWKVYSSGKTKWTEIFNSDKKEYHGTGDVFNPAIGCTLVDKKEKCYEINVHLPALGAVVLK